MRQPKPAYGRSDGMSYAVCVPGVDNALFRKPFGHQLDDLRRIRKWKTAARVVWVDAKCKPTLPAVRRWIREHRPAAFYARWRSDDSMYKHDSIELFYT